MATITFTGTVQNITPFERVNTHVKLLYPERFVAITIRGASDNTFYVTFTRKNSAFAKAAVEGLTCQFSGKFKREQDHANLGGQIVLTNMVVGKYRFQGAAEKRIAKNLARACKLGLA